MEQQQNKINININETFNFGKHKNKRVVDVYESDKGYIEWVVREYPNSASKCLYELCSILVKNNGIVNLKKPENNYKDRFCEGKPLCKGKCEHGFCIFKISKDNVLEVYKNNRELIYSFFFCNDMDTLYHTRLQNQFMMNQFFNDLEFECPVCLENKMRNYKLLCSHGFCSSCLFKISKQSGRDIKCPICRQQNINFLK